MELTFDTLMARASDEPDAMYGLVGQVGVDFAPTSSPTVSRMRPEARFHDGSKLTGA